jgi:hypothetical protein
MPKRRAPQLRAEAEGVKLAGVAESRDEPGDAPARRGAPAATSAISSPRGPANGRLERAIARPAATVPAALPIQGALDLFGGGATLEEAGSLERLDSLEALTARLHAVRARAIHGLALLPVVEDGGRSEAPVGLALAARDGTACYLPLAHATGPNFAADAVKDWLEGALADPTVPKFAAHVKVLLHVLSRLGLPFAGRAFDLHLASFVCDPDRDHSLDALAADVLGEALPPLEAPAARGRPRPQLGAAPVAELAPAVLARVAAIPPLAAALRAQLEAREQWNLYSQIEEPLVRVLFEMERTGIRVDRALLEEMAARAGEDIARLEAELQGLAGEPVNLNSGQQLAKLLFERFGLKSGRRTKTGFSTDQATLEELAEAHPFPKRLLEYRALSKLKSTYLDALPLEVDPRDGRVHTTYHQAGAATGRLSSSDRIFRTFRMRTPQGRAIRRAFVARAGRRALVGADYSQIELRVMAHLSGDPADRCVPGGEDSARTRGAASSVSRASSTRACARAREDRKLRRHAAWARGACCQQMGIRCGRQGVHRTLSASLARARVPRPHRRRGARTRLRRDAARAPEVSPRAL